MQVTHEVLVFSYTDSGPHQENDDACGYRQLDDGTLVAAIADGVGSAKSGREAAEFAVDKFLSVLEESPDADLVNTVKTIHDNLSRNADEKLTTFSACRIKNYKLQAVHAGDTRICILRGNGIKQITEDHTELNRLVRAGKLSSAEAVKYPRKHVIDSALGMEGTPRIDSVYFDLQPHDRVLLTTDGVHGILSKKRLRDIFVSSHSVNEVVVSIGNAVDVVGATDNLTAMVLGIE